MRRRLFLFVGIFFYFRHIKRYISAYLLSVHQLTISTNHRLFFRLEFNMSETKEAQRTIAEHAIQSEITAQIASTKAFVCPFAIRLAWHASGTYDKDDSTPNHGGSNGATMRFQPEITDGANAGLAMMQEILKPVKKKFPGLSVADLWTLAGVQAIKLMGGPEIPFRFGRTDVDSPVTCPMNGRLPDAAQGAQHLRDVFYRMGFNDRDIVALSGAHTCGSCHERRSGYDGPWTSCPTKFDNEYFVNLLNLKWTKRHWEGPLQYTDPTGTLMMLPTDMALVEDEVFAGYVMEYANDEELFFKDFAAAFAKLIALGCPQHCQPNYKGPNVVVEEEESKDTKEFRDMCMHGNLIRLVAKEATGSPDPNSKEPFTLRTPLHKASYFGHEHVVEYLLELGVDVNAQDVEGDTPLHDACRLNHTEVINMLIKAGAKRNIKNVKGETATSIMNARKNGSKGKKMPWRISCGH